ncbi:MAG: hypothetical protein HY898_10815 [Deltaproteobacteria bacterium]|nr:hypothetical protein [Deltaproteobacteria bacterium]
MAKGGPGGAGGAGADASTATGGSLAGGAGGSEPVSGGAPGWSASPDKAHYAKDGGTQPSGYPNVPTSVAITPTGSVIVTGISRPQLYFMGEPGTICATGGGSDGTTMFFDSSGTFTACTSVASTGDDAMNDLALDSTGYVDVVGSIGGETYIDGLKQTFHGDLDVFVAQLDLAGYLTWSKTFGYQGVQEAFGVATDAQNNMVIAGGFEGTIISGGDALNAVGSRSAFVFKLDREGSWQWGRSYGGGYAIAQSVGVSPDGHVFVVGQFDGPLDLGTSHYVSQGNLDMFVLALDPDGEILWSKALGNAQAQTPTRIKVDPQGNVAVVGRSTGTLDFGGGAIEAARESVFFAWYSADGTHRWSQQYEIGDEPDLTPSRTSIAFDLSSNAIVAGAYTGSTDFGNGPLTSTKDANVFLAAWTPTGAPMWSHAYGAEGVQAARAVAYDPQGGLAVAGVFRDWLDFGAGPVGPTQTNGAMFVVKYAPW